MIERTELPEGTAFVLADDGLLNEVTQWLLASGVRLRAVTPQRASLEELFLDAVRTATGTADAADPAAIGDAAVTARPAAVRALPRRTP
jgi:hypothetical protein